MNQSATPPAATGLKRLVYCFLGLVCVGLGYLGAILPGLPVTPFLLAASFFFVRSSPRLHRWLRRSPWFGRLLHDWEEHRGIRLSVKITAACIIVAVVSISVIFGGLPLWAKILVPCLALVGLSIVLALPTLRYPTPQEPALRAGESAHPDQTHPPTEPR